MTERDNWERIGHDEWVQHLAPRDARQYLTGEGVPFLTIHGADGRYWLRRDDQAGASAFDTLEAAKAAGDGVVQASYEGMNTSVIESLRVNLEAWDVEIDHGTISLISRLDDDVFITGRDGEHLWWLHRGEDEVLLKSSDLASALSEADQVIAPTPSLML